MSLNASRAAQPVPVSLLTAARDPEQVERAWAQLTPLPREDVLARIKKAVCDVARLRILQALSAGPISVDDLALLVERTPTATSQHLRVLRDLALVERQRRGTVAYYRLCASPETNDVLAVAHRLTQGAREALMQREGSALPTS